MTSCDKVENPYPENLATNEGDWSLYPDGDSAHYAQNAWPTFSTNTNTDRNVIIEDFTGHKCVFCPAAAAVAEQLEYDNPGRVYVSTIHASPNGLGEFQELDAIFTHDFTCSEGLAIGLYFGDNWANSDFTGNPDGTVNRDSQFSGQPVLSPASWTSAVSTTLGANDLKVNIQSAVNYYPSTRGVFLHTEVDVIDQSLTNELRIVVQLHEDSIVSPQKYPDSTSYNYVHHDVLRRCIDGRAFGQMLDAEHMSNDKYYYDYIYELPAQYDASNVHLLIYVRDAVTEEIYQVIKQKIE